MSTGLPMLASAGRNAASRAACRGGELGTTVSPAASQASTARMPGPAGVGDDRRRGARGQRLRVEAGRDVEHLVDRVGADDARTGGTARRRRRRWPRAPRCGCRRRAIRRACVRPSPRRSASAAPMRRASRAKRRGLPNDSRYSRMTRRRGSSSQYCEQVVARDVGLVADADEGRQADAARSRASCRIAMPSAPLCDEQRHVPAGGKTGEKEAFRRTAGSC